ncbi:MAG: hypothetical protein CVV44_06785 [Spirochaetae bacterium HGW-Spirochaetae-1]|nr:MAG: hypothetical protein CVV44_06785 [Spirochaetae bacterium HGW-Spirochaetae-1]
MKIRILSLGCRLNMAEIQSVSTELQDCGHEIVTTGPADVYIVNSCSVTVTSERKTRKLVYQSLREMGSDPAARVIVTGCGAGEERCVDNVYYLSNDYKYLIPELVTDWNLFDSLDVSMASRFQYRPALKSSRTRINLKVQDGCDNFCSYCIIPFVRGAPVSRSLTDITDEFRELVAAGYREFLLAGVMVGHYRDGNADLAGLVEHLLGQEGDFRLHLSSLSPPSMTPWLINLLEHDKMVRHLNLSLQSGSDRILTKMNRRYTRRDYLDTIEDIRKKMPLFNFTTDIIVGFPGETKEDHDDTLACITEAGFSHIHTFRYSPRPGTAAAAMEDTVSESIKSERSAEVISLYTGQKRRYYGLFDGGTSRFLSERFRSGITRGFNEYYVPVAVQEKLERSRFHIVRTTLNQDGSGLTGTVEK